MWWFISEGWPVINVFKITLSQFLNFGSAPWPHGGAVFPLHLQQHTFLSVRLSASPPHVTSTKPDQLKQTESLMPKIKPQHKVRCYSCPRPEAQTVKTHTRWYCTVVFNKNKQEATYWLQHHSAASQYFPFLQHIHTHMWNAVIRLIPRGRVASSYTITAHALLLARHILCNVDAPFCLYVRLQCLKGIMCLTSILSGTWMFVPIWQLIHQCYGISLKTTDQPPKFPKNEASTWCSYGSRF